MNESKSLSIVDVVTLAKAYSDLGWAVQEQLQDALDGRPEDCNPNALDIIRRWLKQAVDLGVLDADEALSMVGEGR